MAETRGITVAGFVFGAALRDDLIVLVLAYMDTFHIALER